MEPTKDPEPPKIVAQKSSESSDEDEESSDEEEKPEPAKSLSQKMSSTSSFLKQLLNQQTKYALSEVKKQDPMVTKQMEPLDNDAVEDSVTYAKHHKH